MPQDDAAPAVEPSASATGLPVQPLAVVPQDEAAQAVEPPNPGAAAILGENDPDL